MVSEEPENYTLIVYRLGFYDGKAVNRAETADTIEALRAENTRLREALKPFVFGDATLFELLYENKPDDTLGTVTISLGDLRAARAAMGESDE